MSDIIKGKIENIEAYIVEEKRAFFIGAFSITKYVVTLETGEVFETYNSLKEYSIGDEIAFIKRDGLHNIILNPVNAKAVLKEDSLSNKIIGTFCSLIVGANLFAYVYVLLGNGVLSMESFILFISVIVSILFASSIKKEFASSLSKKDKSLLRYYFKKNKNQDSYKDINILDINQIKDEVR